MIQRKQTLFLLFSIILMVGYCFAPILKVEGGGGPPYFLYPYSMFFSKNVNFPIIGHYFVLLCLVSAIVAISLNFLTIILFMYRRVQTLLCWLTIIPLIYTFCYVYYKWSATETTQDQYFYFGNLSPLVAIVFVFLAMFYIRKDEELVKSVDRLR
ncbi:MAG: hypothetical protein JWO03_1597 [Bacteroidetes bacterium]|nr:hypothetical protein [Bacteroidota bacterium]